MDSIIPVAVDEIVIVCWSYSHWINDFIHWRMSFLFFHRHRFRKRRNHSHEIVRYNSVKESSISSTPLSPINMYGDRYAIVPRLQFSLPLSNLYVKGHVKIQAQSLCVRKGPSLQWIFHFLKHEAAERIALSPLRDNSPSEGHHLYFTMFPSQILRKFQFLKHEVTVSLARLFCKIQAHQPIKLSPVLCKVSLRVIPTFPVSEALSVRRYCYLPSASYRSIGRSLPVLRLISWTFSSTHNTLWWRNARWQLRLSFAK